MLINDKRENINELPVKNIIQGNCFIYKYNLFIKTNASEWIEQANPNDCFCLRLDNGRLTKLDKETIVTAVETECNMINNAQRNTYTKEDLAEWMVNEKLKEKNPKLKNENVPEPIKEIFPDWETIPKGEWSTHGIIFKTADDTCIEIGLYREPDTEPLYSGTLTLQIYEDDNVILSKRVSKNEHQNRRKKEFEKGE